MRIPSDATMLIWARQSRPASVNPLTSRWILSGVAGWIRKRTTPPSTKGVLRWSAICQKSLSSVRRIRHSASARFDKSESVTPGKSVLA